ncbi:MAG: 50S ribosomal protein L29 [Candidatus Altiarchaeota archaeon]
MAILRASEVREKDDSELDTDLTELRKTLMKIRGGLASGGIPEDVGKVREIKKTIARILTIRHEKKLGLKKEQKPKKTAVESQMVEKPTMEKTKPEEIKKTKKSNKGKEEKINKKSKKNTEEVAKKK